MTRPRRKHAEQPTRPRKLTRARLLAMLEPHILGFSRAHLRGICLDWARIHREAAALQRAYRATMERFHDVQAALYDEVGQIGGELLLCLSVPYVDWVDGEGPYDAARARAALKAWREAREVAVSAPPTES